jgi:hypothetical protein
MSSSPARTSVRVALIAALAAALVCLGWYLASPYIALRYLRTAVVSGDQHALADVADYPALRADLKAQLNAGVAERFGALTGNGGSPADAIAGAIASTIGSAAIGRVVDGFVTPQGLRMVFTAGVAPDGPLTDGRFDDVEVKVTRHGWSRFTAVVERKGIPPGVTNGSSASDGLGSTGAAVAPAAQNAQEADAPPLVLGFVRHGLGWKLAAVKLRSVEVGVSQDSLMGGDGLPLDQRPADASEPPGEQEI